MVQASVDYPEGKLASQYTIPIRPARITLLILDSCPTSLIIILDSNNLAPSRISRIVHYFSSLPNMSFLFGGRPQLSSAEKISAAESEIEMVSDMFNRYVT